MWHGTRTHARGGPPHPCAQCARRKPEPWLISTEYFRGCILRQGVPNLEAEGHAGLKPPFCITRSLLVEFKTQTRAQKMRALRQRLLGPRLHLKTHYRSRLTLNGPRMGLSVQDLKVERGTPSRSVKKTHACGRVPQGPLIISVVKFRGATELCEVRRRQVRGPLILLPYQNKYQIVAETLRYNLRYRSGSKRKY
jgi:hypothetical protein